jgi:hypothetical protein
MREGYLQIDVGLWTTNPLQSGVALARRAIQKWFNLNRSVRDTFFSTLRDQEYDPGPPFDLYNQDESDQDGMRRLYMISQRVSSSILSVIGFHGTFTFVTHPANHKGRAKLIEPCYKLKQQVLKNENMIQYDRLKHLLTNHWSLRTIMVMAQDWERTLNPSLISQTDQQTQLLYLKCLGPNSLKFWKLKLNVKILEVIPKFMELWDKNRPKANTYWVSTGLDPMVLSRLSNFVGSHCFTAWFCKFDTIGKFQGPGNRNFPLSNFEHHRMSAGDYYETFGNYAVLAQYSMASAYFHFCNSHVSSLMTTMAVRL